MLVLIEDSWVYLQSLLHHKIGDQKSDGMLHLGANTLLIFHVRRQLQVLQGEYFEKNLNILLINRLLNKPHQTYDAPYCLKIGLSHLRVFWNFLRPIMTIVAIFLLRNINKYNVIIRLGCFSSRNSISAVWESTSSQSSFHIGRSTDTWRYQISVETLSMSFVVSTYSINNQHINIFIISKY